MEGAKLSGARKASLGLRLYRDEMVHPTPRPAPPYADYETHDHVLAQITRKRASSGADVATLKKTRETMNPGEVKDCLTLFLALKGDVAVKDNVTEYAVDRKNPMRLRELACGALGTLAVKTQDAKIGDTLAQAIREDTQAAYEKGKEGKLAVVFPVRKAAVAAIKRMDKEGILLPSYVTGAADRAMDTMKLPDPKAAPKK